MRLMSSALALMVVSAVCAVGLAGAGMKRWTSHGPVDVILTLAADPTAPGTVYAGGQRGIFKSTDSGRTWLYRPQKTPTYVTAIGIAPSSPNVVYAGTSFLSDTDVSVFRSDDAGVSWTRVTTPPSAAYGITTLTVDPRSADTVYATSSGYGFCCGVMRSTDGGDSWTQLIRLYGTDGFALDPAGMTLYAVSGPAVWKSADAGETWAEHPLRAPLDAVVVDPSRPDIVYAAGSKTFKSRDAGETWSDLAIPIAYGVAIDQQTPSTVYFSVDEGVMRSLDRGRTWTILSRGFPPSPRVDNVTVDAGDGTVYAEADDADAPGVWTYSFR